jgi:hypothetical protein
MERNTALCERKVRHLSSEKMRSNLFLFADAGEPEAKAKAMHQNGTEGKSVYVILVVCETLKPHNACMMYL